MLAGLGNPGGALPWRHISPGLIEGLATPFMPVSWMPMIEFTPIRYHSPSRSRDGNFFIFKNMISLRLKLIPPVSVADLVRHPIVHVGAVVDRQCHFA